MRVKAITTLQVDICHSEEDKLVFITRNVVIHQLVVTIATEMKMTTLKGKELNNANKLK